MKKSVQLTNQKNQLLKKKSNLERRYNQVQRIVNDYYSLNKHPSNISNSSVLLLNALASGIKGDGIAMCKDLDFRSSLGLELKSSEDDLRSELARLRQDISNVSSDISRTTSKIYAAKEKERLEEVQ